MIATTFFAGAAGTVLAGGTFADRISPRGAAGSPCVMAGMAARSWPRPR